MSLEDKINRWRKGLRKHSGMSDGFVEELESHIRDHVQHLLDQGIPEDESFNMAVQKLGDTAAMNHDEQLVNYNNDRKRFLPPGLLRNFIKVSRRQFKKNVLLNGINLFGLTIAFTALLFIGLFLNDELSFERHHNDAEKIYRLGYEFTGENGVTEKRAYTSGMWIDMIKDNHPAIEETARFLTLSYGYMRNDKLNRSFYDENIYWSTPNFFDFFGFDFILGDSDNQLNDPSSLVLTESMAKLHFGEENPIGQPLQYVRQGRSVNLIVTGVIKDPPSNTQFRPRYIALMDAIEGIYGEHNRGWTRRNPAPGYVFSFLKLTDTNSIAAIEEDLQGFWNTTIPALADFMKPTFTKLVDIHFNPPIKWEQDTPISMSYVYGLMVVAGFILVIALTNFINLTTAQGTKRQKEIGLRKTLGSSKKQLRIQFFMESAGLTMFSLICALFLVYLLLPYFNDLIEKNIQFTDVLFSLLIPLVAFALLISGLTGLFPALFFTRKIKDNFNLNQFFKAEKSGTLGRNVLVVLQFTVALMLIISTITVFNQLQLINNGKLGENREAVIGIRTSRMGTDQQAQRYINEINTYSQVEATTLGMHLPRQSDFGRINTKYFVREVDDEARFWNKFDADGGFAKTYNLEFLAGTDFRETYDTTSYIINEAAVKDLGIIPSEAVGLFLKEDSIAYTYGRSDGVVIGVVKDFAYKSIKEKVEPLVIAANTLSGGVLSVKLGSGPKQATIKTLEEKWQEIYPGRPFEYWFLDKEFDRLYHQERRLGKLIPMFSGLAIVIALLGLFALTAYISELRKKEIGIRKVLGCSSRGILALLSTQYLKIIGLATVIAIPIAMIGMNYWLDNFTYRVSVDVLVIVGSTFFILILALFTMGIKSLRASKANPVESLKYE